MQPQADRPTPPGLAITPVPGEPTRYRVGPRLHLVDADYEGGWACGCEDFMCRNRECKHIRAVKIFRAAG